MRLRLPFKYPFGCDRDRDFTWRLVSRLCRLMCGRSLTVSDLPRRCSLSYGLCPKFGAQPKLNWNECFGGA